MEIETSRQQPRLFGLPLIFSTTEQRIIVTTLEAIWSTAYGQAMQQLDEDLELCRQYFDPALRGSTLRSRIEALSPLSAVIHANAVSYLTSVVTDLGKGRLLVGVEGRLVLDYLHNRSQGGTVVVSSADIVEMQLVALKIYRNWSCYRLDQVISLMSGHGAEVLQAPSVGIVLALLVNRSTTPDRAVVRPEKEGLRYERRHAIDVALHAAATAFANEISPRSKRSQSEQQLKGGYILSEARRRLGSIIVVTKDKDERASHVYIDANRINEALNFLALDLARRPGLSSEQVASGFDALVEALRDGAAQLAQHRVVFERPADTAILRAELLTAFAAAKAT